VNQAKEVFFRKKDGRNYTQEIMKTINYMIERSNQEFDYFKNLFSSIFEEVFRPAQKRKASAEMQEETHEDHVYSEKVRNYTKYIISQKINKNTPKYTEEEIENGIFFVKSPSVLRVITKWVE
jgi:anaerobic ribonucleoside-triphosphate reductase